MSKIKVYTPCIIYNDAAELVKWRDKLLSDNAGNIVSIGISDDMLVLEHKQDPYSFPYTDPAIVSWRIIKYNAEDNDWYCCISRYEAYFAVFLDGIFKAEDIMFVLSRVRMGEYYEDKK